MFEQYAGFYVNEEQNKELFADIKKFEQETGGLVYAVTHEHTQFGECYDYLYIPRHKEDWHDLIFYSHNNDHVVFAYVDNKDAPEISESGDITIRTFGGGLTRIA